MRIACSIEKKILHFKELAITSRASYLERKVYYIRMQSLEQPEQYGIGEIAPLEKLSIDDIADFEDTLYSIINKIQEDSDINFEQLQAYPSICFGLETALKSLKSKNNILWDSAFARGEKGIDINGLIWMGTYEKMFARIKEKIEAGYNCIKIKIASLDFEQELKLLKHIRKDFSSSDIELRLDANGGFKAEDALEKLKILSDFDIHSLEQPIKAGQYEQMAFLCEKSPIKIALDEELIPIIKDREKLLERVKAHYLILKPSLHGGIYGCSQWIALAQKHNMDWWLTSSLESNIGLNAIAQWCASLNVTLPQGLGTGQLFTDNIDMGLEIKNAQLWRNL